MRLQKSVVGLLSGPIFECMRIGADTFSELAGRKLHMVPLLQYLGVEKF